MCTIQMSCSYFRDGTLGTDGFQRGEGDDAGGANVWCEGYTTFQAVGQIRNRYRAVCGLKRTL